MTPIPLSMETEDIIRAMPKLEQHIHIVGSTRPETLLWLAQESGKSHLFGSLDDIMHFFQYRDFPHFIQVYTMVDDCITRESQYERLTYEMLEADALCNVRHVEAIFSANDHVRRGLDYGLMLDSINRGIRRARRDLGISCTIRIDLVRNYGPKIGMDALSWIEEKGDNVVAVDLGGSEHGFPPEPYEEVYRRAAEMGLHLVAHAGEAAGPESVWGAIDRLGVERIGHGIAAARDAKLMKRIREKKITIEACPVSNLRTGAIKSIEVHPIRTFMENGIRVTVNSDDPPMFGTDMNNEYLTLHRGLDFTPEELFKISLDAVDSAFLPEKERRRLRWEFIKTYESIMI
jgi:adenosine deaminase